MADSIDMSEMMKRAVQANAKFYKGWVDLTLDYVRGLSEVLNGQPVATETIPEMDSGAGTLVLEGESGSNGAGSFLVTNDLGRTIECEFVASAFNDPDGKRVTIKPVFEPAKLSLASGEQRVVQVTVPVEQTLTAGVGYAGELSIRGMDGFAVPVVLRRLHVVEEQGSAAEPIDPKEADAAIKRSSASGRKAPSKRATHRKSAK